MIEHIWVTPENEIISDEEFFKRCRESADENGFCKGGIATCYVPNSLALELSGKLMRAYVKLMELGVEPE